MLYNKFMDPAQPTNETDELKKLEEELKAIDTPPQSQVSTPEAPVAPPPAQEQATPPLTQPSVPPEPKSSNVLMVALGFLVLSLVGVSAYFLGSRKGGATPTPTPYASPTPTPDPTASWQVYTNTTYGYSIKYPSDFKTQVQAAGAGEKEAGPDARNLFLYQSGAKEPYLERYINLEVFQVEPSYGPSAVITKATLDNREASKITIPGSKFEIYKLQIGEDSFIEIFVSSDPARKDTADLILSTFKFIKPSPKPFVTPITSPKVTPTVTPTY